MISTQKVKECLSSISSLSADEIEQHESLVDNAVAVAEKEFKSEETDSSVLFAAAKANYDIALALSMLDSVTSFKAGDISITEKGERLNSARALFENVLSDCSDTVSDAGFVFKTV